MSHRGTGDAVSIVSWSTSARAALRAAVVTTRRHRRRSSHRAILPRHAVRRAWSSSTPTRMADARSTWPAAALAARPARSTPSASPTSGPRPSCGTGRPASRSARRSAGRTCARSARASCCQADGLSLAPNQSATKVACLLDTARPRPRRATCASARVDTWIAWTSSERRAPRHRPHQRRRHRPARPSTARLGRPTCSRRSRIPRRCCRRIVDSTRRGRPRPPRSPGAPPIAGIAGDQQASLIGQGCVRPGLAKITFGTGGMLDLVPRRRRARLRRAGAPAARSRSSPGARDGDAHLGRRGDHAVGRHQRRVAARRPRHHRRPRAETHDVAGRSASHRRRRVRARPARPRHAAVGLRRARHAARHHPGHRPAADRAGRARRRRPARAPTSSRRPRPTPASRSPSLRVDGGMSRQPHVRAGAGRRHPAPGRGLARAEATTLGAALPRRPRRRHVGRRRAGRRDAATWRGGWNRRATSPRCGSSAGPSGGTPSVAPAAGSPSCPPSSSEGARAAGSGHSAGRKAVLCSPGSRYREGG